MKKPQRKPKTSYPPELPEGRPMPHEANPNGIEGADSGWRGGSSGILGPAPEGDTTYSTKDLPPEGRTEVVRAIHCDKCGQAFVNVAMLNVHRRTAHRLHE